MKKIRISLVVAALAAIAMIAAPAAASAVTYPPNQTVTVSAATIAPGGTVVVQAFNYAPFTTGMTLTLTGESANSFTLALMKLAVSSKTFGPVTANGSGVATFTLNAPSSVTGSYTAVVSAPGYADQTVSFSVASSSGLPATGVDAASMAGIWIGGGVLLLGGLVVTVVAARRKSAAQER